MFNAPLAQMDIVITYLAPAGGAHSGIVGKQSEKRFDSFDDVREWVLENIPVDQQRGVKLWANDLEITGATRDATFRPFPAH